MFFFLAHLALKKKSNTRETCGKYNHIEQLNLDGKWEVNHLKNLLATFFLIHKEKLSVITNSNTFRGLKY